MTHARLFWRCELRTPSTLQSASPIGSMVKRKHTLFVRTGPTGHVRGQSTFLARVRTAVQSNRSFPSAQTVPGSGLPTRADAAVPDRGRVQPGKRHVGLRQLRRHTRRHVLLGRRVRRVRVRSVPVRRQQPRPTAPVRSGPANKCQ